MRRARPVDRTPRVSAKINDQITAREVRLVGSEGEPLGVRTADDARAYADERDLDLVEVASSSTPPVCKVMDYGKWRYEEERRLRASRRNRTSVSFKEVRLRPRIGEHDYEWKRDRAAEFLRPQLRWVASSPDGDALARRLGVVALVESCRDEGSRLSGGAQVLLRMA